MRGFKKDTFIRVEKDVDIPVTKISTVLKKNVCKKFLNLGNKIQKIYDVDLPKREIKLSNPEFLKTNSEILYRLIIDGRKH